MCRVYCEGLSYSFLNSILWKVKKGVIRVLEKTKKVNGRNPLVELKRGPLKVAFCLYNIKMKDLSKYKQTQVNEALEMVKKLKRGSWSREIHVLRKVELFHGTDKSSYFELNKNQTWTPFGLCFAHKILKT